jgi:hypothetical protein
MQPSGSPDPASPTVLRDPAGPGQPDGSTPAEGPAPGNGSPEAGSPPGTGSGAGEGSASRGLRRAVGNRRRALLAAAVALPLAAGLAVAVRPDPAPRPPAAAPGDGCVVGSWTVESYTEDVPLAQLGTVRFTGSGARTVLRADGTGSTDYGTATVYRARVNGRLVTLTVAGTVRYRYRATGGMFTSTDPVSNARSTVSVDGRAVTAAPLTVNPEPAGYTCAGGVLTQSTGSYRIRLRRD